MRTILLLERKRHHTGDLALNNRNAPAAPQSSQHPTTKTERVIREPLAMHNAYGHLCYKTAP
jgi:hypothetical protein